MTLKWTKHKLEIISEEAEHNGAVIAIDSIQEYFQVYLQFGVYKIVLGEFESLTQAKKCIKNGIKEIDSIIQHLIAIQREVLDFCCEPE